MGGSGGHIEDRSDSFKFKSTVKKVLQKELNVG